MACTKAQIWGYSQTVSWIASEHAGGVNVDNVTSRTGNLPRPFSTSWLFLILLMTAMIVHICWNRRNDSRGHLDMHNCNLSQSMLSTAHKCLLIDPFALILVVCCCRAEGGCSEPYLSADLALVRCYTCNRMGHLCCKEGPQEPPEPSCHNCGDAGHMAVDCRMTKPQKASLSVLSCMQSHAQPSSSAGSCMAIC